MIGKMARRLANKVWANRPIEPNNAWANRPVEISWDELEGARFCFAGEFGYELVSWLPYVNFLSSKTPIPLKTASRPGSLPLYYFSADHCELQPNDIGNMWGDVSTYWRLAQRFEGERLIFPGPQFVNRKHISVAGYDWEVKDIHARIRAENYLLPPYGELRKEIPFKPNGPLVTINNKYFVQWSPLFDSPVNYFNRDELILLRDLLVRCGFFVVYNHFTEKTSHDEHLRLNDEGIFGHDEHTVDMRTYYGSMDSSARNECQMAVYARSASVIGPQGGNLYLPAICGCNLIVLMRHGVLLDYQELARLGNARVEAFYDSKHMILWLKTEDGLVTLRGENGSVITEEATDSIVKP